jgi:hypothetical protein
VQLGSHVPKARVHDCAAVASKGCTRLTSVARTGNAGVTCQQAAIIAVPNHHKLLTTLSRGYSGDAIRRDNSTLLTMFGMVVRLDRPLPTPL